jgi:hypothetical protein
MRTENYDMLQHLLQFAEAFLQQAIVYEVSRQLSWAHPRSLIYINDLLKNAPRSPPLRAPRGERVAEGRERVALRVTPLHLVDSPTPLTLSYPTVRTHDPHRQFPFARKNRSMQNISVSDPETRSSDLIAANLVSSSSPHSYFGFR